MSKDDKYRKLEFAIKGGTMGVALGALFYGKKKVDSIQSLAFQKNEQRLLTSLRNL